MTDLLKLKDIIPLLPLIIIYTVPGYIFIYIKNFILGKNQQEDNKVILKSLIISYIMVNFTTLILSLFGYIMNTSLSSHIILLFTVTALCGYLYARFADSDLGNELLFKFSVRSSLRENILNDAIDSEYGMWLRVYLSSEKLVYLGQLIQYDSELEKNIVIVLSKYIIYDYDGNVLQDNSENNTERVLISIKDNFRIDLIYNSASKKIK